MAAKKNHLPDILPFGYTEQNGDFNGLVLSEIDSHTPENSPFRTESYAIVLCVSGHCMKSIGAHTFQVTPHSVHIAKPGAVQLIFGVSPDIKGFVITFSPSFFLDTPVAADIIEQLLTLNPALPPIFSLHEDDFESINNTFDRINTEYKLNTTFSKDIILNMLIELLYRVNRLCTEKPTEPDSAVSRNEQLVRAYKRLIDKHFLTYKTVKEYAALLKVSPKYLGEVIKAETCQTALPIIHHRIIQEARHLLKYTTQTIKEISYVLNFESMAHFSRFFKKYTGISPSDFRKSDEA